MSGHQVAAYQQALSARANCGHRSLGAQDLGRETAGGADGRLTSVEPSSNDAYERLLTGETVSWHQIMRDNPMLGTITVAQLVNAGVVRVMPDYDPVTGTIDFRLRKLKP